MKPLYAFVMLIALSYAGMAQHDTACINNVLHFQKELVDEYDTPATTPLKGDAAKTFKGIHFFPVDTSWCVTARFTRTPGEKTFSMPTSGTISKEYVKYAEAVFRLKGREYKLNIYQSVDLSKQRKYRNHLFIPFRDVSSGKETYGGGRYLDLQIPMDDSIQINFNTAYHPYCAYTEGYNCPIPPRQNYLPLKIEAGVRF